MSDEVLLDLFTTFGCVALGLFLLGVGWTNEEEGFANVFYKVVSTLLAGVLFFGAYAVW